MLNDVTTLRKHYRRTAFLRDAEQADILLSLLKGNKLFNVFNDTDASECGARLAQV